MDPKEFPTPVAGKERAQWVAATKAWERAIYFRVRKTQGLHVMHGSNGEGNVLMKLLCLSHRGWEHGS